MIVVGDDQSGTALPGTLHNVSTVNAANGEAVQVMTYGISLPPWDSCVETEPNNYTEVYTYTSGGTTVATVTVTYASSAKSRLVSVVRS